MAVRGESSLGYVLGGHFPARDGLRFLISNARALGYNAVQTMLCSGREYEPMEVTDEAGSDYRAMSFGITTYVHLPYVINPCEGQPRRKNWYRRMFRMHVRAAMQLGAAGVVIHPGYKKTLSEGEAFRNSVDFFEASMEEEWDIDILFETDAGSKNGSAVGSPEFIQDLILKLDMPQYGMCIDTVHLYARGWVDLWNADNREIFLERHGRMIRLVHLNSPDPKVSYGSHLDRHNTPMSDHPEWDHEGMVRDLARWPMILERSSIQVQKLDAEAVRGYMTK